MPTDYPDPPEPTAANKRSQPKFLRRASVLSVFALVFGLGVTASVSMIEYNHARNLDDEHFNRLVERIQAEVTRRVTVYRYGLMGTRSVFAASSYVHRQEFVHLVNARDLPSEFPGALGIGYIERVPDTPGEVASFVEYVHDEGAPWFEITVPPGAAPLEGSLTDDRYIIKYIEPLADNRSAHGLDIGAHPVRREAAERALRANDASLTGMIQLVQDDQHVAGFLYLLPHYKSGMPLDTLEQRTEALVGWVYMPMLGPKVFEGITGAADGELDIDVFDNDRLGSETLIFDADGALDPTQAGYGPADYSDRAFHTIRELEIGGRTWMLSISSTPAFRYNSLTGVWIEVIGGTVLSFLLAALVFVQTNSSRKAWSLAEGMTSDLRKYATKAGQATKAKSDFLANMSHEIRTPMTAILGFTDLLNASIKDEQTELREHTRTIKRNGEHLLSLINDILDVSKIEAGKLDIEKIEVRPDALISEVLSLMSVKADEKRLPLEAELTSPVPSVIQSDPVRLRQIMVNLVGNAIKFTSSGRVRIEVWHDGPMQELKIAVRDTGLGMTPEQSAKLFKPFEQADTTTSREFGGTGLGLHISQRLAGMLGGQISCNSEYGKGSTFTLTVYTGVIENTPMLPTGKIDAVNSNNQSPPARHSTGEQDGAAPPLAGLVILLAEDGKDNQRLINHHLTKAGARVTIVENGRKAVEALCVQNDLTGPLHQHPPFDLLITDMQMPEMDGYTAAHLLREKGSTLPIVALTAHAMKEDIAKCLDAGCDFYASKPINKQKLIEICSEAVARPGKGHGQDSQPNAA